MIRKILKALIPEKKRYLFSFFLFSVRGLFYRGKDVYCNCCGKTFTKFLPFNKRDNAACPSCNSLERNRLLLYYFLENETDFFSRKLKVLHFAPEYSLEKMFQKQINLDYLSVDLNPALAMRKVDIMDIPFPENTFDYIICSHVLMHVPDERKALSELFRVTKPGGKTILVTLPKFTRETTYEVKGVVSEEEREKVYGDPTWFRIHGEDFPETVKKAGFEVTELKPAGNLNAELCRYNGFRSDEPFYLCTKPS